MTRWIARDPESGRSGHRLILWRRLDSRLAGFLLYFTMYPALASSPQFEPAGLLRAIVLTFPLNLVLLPAALVIPAFISRQLFVAVTVSASIRETAAHRTRTKRWLLATGISLALAIGGVALILLRFAMW